jgi:hypothetical protein
MSYKNVQRKPVESPFLCSLLPGSLIAVPLMISLLGDTSCSESLGMSAGRVATQPSPVRAFFAIHSALSSEDNSKVDYTSMLGEEGRRQRFSEEVVDKDLKDSVRVQKMYRQLHSPFLACYLMSLVVELMYSFAFLCLQL